MNNSLRLACQGKSKSQGGLNLPEFKLQLIVLFPHLRDYINSITNRLDLVRICREMQN
jgi:hypothetical protein